MTETTDTIAWNVPLSDELFQPPDLTGWTIGDRRDHIVTFTHTALRDHVTLSIGPQNGPAVVTEKDIEAIRYGITTAHTGEQLIIDFNREATNETSVNFVLGGLWLHVALGGFQVDITMLGRTLEQFENEYLTSRK